MTKAQRGLTHLGNSYRNPPVFIEQQGFFGIVFSRLDEVRSQLSNRIKMTPLRTISPLSSSPDDQDRFTECQRLRNYAMDLEVLTDRLKVWSASWRQLARVEPWQRICFDSKLRVSTLLGSSHSMIGRTFLLASAFAWGSADADMLNGINLLRKQTFKDIQTIKARRDLGNKQMVVSEFIKLRVDILAANEGLAHLAMSYFQQPDIERGIQGQRERLPKIIALIDQATRELSI
jgi:hypothetical protein